MKFENWMHEIDKILMVEIRMDTGCCRDRDYYSGWNDGQTPVEFVSSEWGDEFEEMMENEIYG